MFSYYIPMISFLSLSNIFFSILLNFTMPFQNSYHTVFNFFDKYKEDYYISELKELKSLITTKTRWLKFRKQR